MKPKSSPAGIIVVLLCVACMLYYYLIFRHTLETQILHPPISDNGSK